VSRDGAGVVPGVSKPIRHKARTFARHLADRRGALARCRDIADTLRAHGGEEDADAIQAVLREVWRLRRDRTRWNTEREDIRSRVKGLERALALLLAGDPV
jgi:hypothetical protein